MKAAPTCKPPGENTMAEAPRGKEVPSGRERGQRERSENTLGPLQVRYYRRMRLQRVYAAVVSWPDRGDRSPPAGTPPVTVRLLMAGAQIVPSEQTLDAADPDARATFYVTPLAKGWLRHERLEVLVGGRKVQEVPLPAKVTSQWATIALLILALVIPWFLLSVKYSPPQMTPDDLDPKKVAGAKEFDRKSGLFLVEQGKEFRVKERISQDDILLRRDVSIEQIRRHNPKLAEELGLQKYDGALLSDRIAREMPELPGFVEK